MSLYDDVDREADADWREHRYEHDDRPTASELAREEAEALDLPGDEFWVNQREADDYRDEDPGPENRGLAEFDWTPERPDEPF